MAALRSRDLFDDSTMSFGEHLEVLRIHLWRGIIGLAICVTVALFFGEQIIDVVRKPIDEGLARYAAGTENDQQKPVTLEVQEAFMTYLKVSFVTGFVVASPWVFYQLWLFVAAGLYPHERKYVYIYLPMSIILFLTGAVFCFMVVFPFVLDFLLGFNKTINVTPQIRLSGWISFAIMLPVMFGLSFQLPLVMLFLERISIFESDDYRAKRRMAILVIAFLSMIMTPADPVSMLLMMFPLIGLYEFGILLCRIRPAHSVSPFEDAEGAA